MCRRRYKPSIEANNALKKAALSDVNDLIRAIENGRVRSQVPGNDLKDAISGLKKTVSKFDITLGLGSEDVSAVSEQVKKNVKALKKSIQRDLLYGVKGAVSDLEFTLKAWMGILSGDTFSFDFEESEPAKTHAVKKLEAKFKDLEAVGDEYRNLAITSSERVNRHESDIAGLKSLRDNAKNQSEEKMLDLKIKSVENLLKIEMARNSAYTICNNAFETLCAHAQSLIAEVSVAPDKFPMADELLNVKKLRNLIDDPTNAGAVLKRMNEDIKEMLVNADYIEKTMYFDTTGNNSEA